jgi:hypothetical protein
MNLHAARLLKAASIAVIGVGLLGACTNYDPRDFDEDPPASVAPTATPVPSARANSTFRVTLSQATGNDVTIDVTDGTGTLVSAKSGTPGEGASVNPYEVAVTNDDASTLRLTWVGGPCDSANSLSIDALGHQYLLVQPECGGDSIVTDRVLVLSFSKPIAAADVEAVLQDGLDTSS